MKTVPLRALLTRIDDRAGLQDFPLLGVSVAEGVRPRFEGDGRPAASDDRSQYKVVRPGDIVMNALGKPHGSIGRSPMHGITSPAYWVLRAERSRALPEWLHYLLRAHHMVNAYQQLGKNQPPNQFDIGWEIFRSIEVAQIELDEQRRIADFLDDRVSCIDNVIAARRQQNVLADASFRSKIERGLWSGRQRMPLKHLLEDVTSGPRGWGDYVGDSGVPFVRITNLNPLGTTLLRDDLVLVDVEDSAELTRASLRRGDVLLSITATMGSVVVWASDELATFSQHVGRLRPQDAEDSAWIAWTLQSRPILQQFALLAYGGGKIGLNLEQIRNLEVPISRPDERIDLARALDDSFVDYSCGRALQVRSIELLTEYKQSLITAAVTGKLDVTTASMAVTA